jgi:hypothetical protein
MPTTLLLTTPDGQPAQTLTVPTQWADVTLGQYVALQAPEPDDERRPAEILLGLEAGGLDQLAADDVKYLSNLLAFSQDASDVEALLPAPGLPDIGTLPFGILLLAQQYVESVLDRAPLAYGPHLCALYRVQMTFGRYDQAKVEACAAALLASPCIEVAADCAFFLSSYQNWQRGTLPTKRMSTSPTTMRKKLAMTGLRRGTARFSAWIRRLKAPS